MASVPRNPYLAKKNNPTSTEQSVPPVLPLIGADTIHQERREQFDCLSIKYYKLTTYKFKPYMPYADFRLGSAWKTVPDRPERRSFRSDFTVLAKSPPFLEV